MIFILQSILNTVVALHKTSPRPFSRLNDNVISTSEKKLLLEVEFNPRLQLF